VDDSWCCQEDVDIFDPSLTWQYDAFNVTQDGIDGVGWDGTVHVRAGKYDENLVINKSLTLRSTDGWRDTTIDPAMDSIIRIEGDVDVTVQGFEITEGSWGIYIGEVWSTVNILDCFIHDNAFDGIRVVSSGDVLNIERNIISQNGGCNGSGIYIQQAWTTVNILNNIIGAWRDGEGTGATYTGNQNDGIDIDDVPVGTDVIIEGNHIVENGIIVSADHGINLDSVAGNVDIQDNVIGAWTYGDFRFGGNKNHGVHVGPVSDTGRVNIEGNAISENGHDGINFGQGAGAILGRVIIHENLIGGWTCYPGDYGYTGAPERYTGNYGEGIYIYQVGESGMVTIEDNKISENGYDTGIYFVLVYGMVTIARNDIGAWEDSHGEIYPGNEGQGIWVSSVPSGAVLTIGPDNRIKGNTGDGIDILASQLDSSIDIHHNVVQQNGPWVCGTGIKLGSGGVCGAMVRDNIITNNHKGIYLDTYSTQNTIQDNLIRDNGHGVWVEGNDNQILRNNILNNQDAEGSGIHIVSLHGYPVSGNVIHCNNIAGNWPYGVYYETANADGMTEGIYSQNGDEAVDATGNWWGCIDGPGALGCDTVFGNVLYYFWLLDEFQYCGQCGGAPRPTPAPAAPPGVPTVNHWGIVAMITLFAGLLVWRVWRRRLAS